MSLSDAATAVLGKDVVLLLFLLDVATYTGLLLVEMVMVLVLMLLLTDGRDCENAETPTGAEM